MSPEFVFLVLAQATLPHVSASVRPAECGQDSCLGVDEDGVKNALVKRHANCNVSSRLQSE